MNRMLLLGGAAALALAACGPRVEPTPAPAEPAAANGAEAPAATEAKLDGDMAEVIAKLGPLGGKPIGSLESAQARMQPTPADAVMALMAEKKIDPASLPKVTTRNVSYGAGQGEQRHASSYPRA